MLASFGSRKVLIIVNLYRVSQKASKISFRWEFRSSFYTCVRWVSKGKWKFMFSVYVRSKKFTAWLVSKGYFAARLSSGCLPFQLNEQVILTVKGLVFPLRFYYIFRLTTVISSQWECLSSISMFCLFIWFVW